MIDALLTIAVTLSALAGGYVAGCHRTIARNAAHVECLGCSHIGPNTALRAAQGAARAHREATGHVAMVVSK